MGLLADRMKRTELENANKDDSSLVDPDTAGSLAQDEIKSKDEIIVDSISQQHQKTADAEAIENARKVMGGASGVSEQTEQNTAVKESTNTEAKSAADDFMAALGITSASPIVQAAPVSKPLSAASSAHKEQKAPTDPRVKNAIDDLKRIKDLKEVGEKELALREWVEKYGDLYETIQFQTKEYGLNDLIKGFIDAKKNASASVQTQQNGQSAPIYGGGGQSEQGNKFSHSLPSLAHDAGKAASQSVEGIMDSVLSAGATLAGAAGGALGGSIKSIAKHLTRPGKVSAETAFAENAGNERSLFSSVMDTLEPVKVSGAQFKMKMDEFGIEPSSMQENFLKSVAHLDKDQQESVLRSFSEYSQAVDNMEATIKESSDYAGEISDTLKENSLKEIAGRYGMLNSELASLRDEVNDLPVSSELAQIVKKASEQSPDEEISIVDAIINEGPDAGKDAIEKTKKTGDKLSTMMELITKLVEAIMAIFSRDKTKEAENKASMETKSSPMTP